MTAAVRKSAYPVAVEDLIPRARRLSAQIGTVPSRNRLMAEYRIGASKARAILAALSAEPAEGGDPASETPTGGAEVSAPLGHDASQPRTDAPRLRAVPPGSGEQTPGTEEPRPHPDTPGTSLPAEQDTTGSAPSTHAALRAQAETRVDPGTATSDQPGRPVSRWPLLLLAAPAFVAVWSGWVGLGSLAGFGMVHPLPGIADQFSINSAITLPVGVETYAAYALRAWLSGPAQARRFAKWSAIGSLVLGAAGQIAYHLLSASGVRTAPWPITTVVACLPVAVLGMGAALVHLLHNTEATDTDTSNRHDPALTGEA